MNDIFISYRRKGGYETAKHLYDLLIRDGYTVTFDIDTLRNGDFDKALLQRVEECTDFILILNKGAFDRTIDPNFNPNNDWMRNELACALKQNKNVIPVMLDGFDFPDYLPDDISKVVRKNGPKYDNYYFDDFYRKMKKSFFETPEPLPNNQDSKKTANKSLVKFKTNLMCDYYIDGEYQQRVDENELIQISLPFGEYFFEFVSAYNAGVDKCSCKVKLTGEDIAFEIDLESIENKRINLEQKAKELIAAQFDTYNNFYGGLCLSERNSLYGYLNAELDIVIPFIYDDATDFETYYGTAMVKKRGKYGTINLQGKQIIPIEYDKLSGESYLDSVTSKDYIRCLKEGKCGVLNQLGEVVLPIEYDALGEIKFNHCIIISNKKAGLYDLINRKQVLPIEYDKLIVNDNYAVFYNGGYCGLYLLDGSLTTKVRYDKIGFFSEDLAPVKIGKLWGFIDKSDKLIISPRFDECKSFTCGLAAVRKNNKWAYIDHSGNEVTSYKFDEAGHMLAGAAIVKIGDSMGVIDKYESVIYPMTKGVELCHVINAIEHPDKSFGILVLLPDNIVELITPQGKIHKIEKDQYNSFDAFHIVEFEGDELIFSSNFCNEDGNHVAKYDSEDPLPLHLIMDEPIDFSSCEDEPESFKIIKQIIADYFKIDYSELNSECNLCTEYGANDDDFTNLKIKIEDLVGVVVDSENYFRSLVSVREITEYISAIVDADTPVKTLEDEKDTKEKSEDIDTEITKYIPLSKTMTISEPGSESLLKHEYKCGDIYIHEGVEAIIISYNETTGFAKIVTKNVKKASWEDPGFSGFSKILSSKIGDMTPETHKDGMINTRAMKSIKKWHEKYPAIVLCSEYGPDWFLPSIEDFRDGFLNPEIQVHYKKREGENTWYWTSNTKLNDNDQSFIINGEIYGGSATTASRVHFYPVVAMCYVKLK